MAADLSLDTAVRPAGAAGRYAVDLPDAWSYERPSGGVLMTAALRAMQAELADEELLPMSATAIFCTPVRAGSLDIGVEVLRRGNAVTQIRAALSEASDQGGPRLEVSATFGRAREGIDLLDARPPEAPRPEEARPFQMPGRRRRDGSRYPFFENFDARLAVARPWWEEGWAAGEARFARWLRYLVPQQRADGAIDPLAFPPIADTMPIAIAQKLGPGGPWFRAPSLDLTIHFMEPVHSEWLLVATHARRAFGGYASAEAEIWSEDGRLAAYATQTMMLRALRR